VVLILSCLETKYGRNGEFDLLAYEASTNTIAHFQAKAAIPARAPGWCARLKQGAVKGLSSCVYSENVSSDKRGAVAIICL